jgi:hypothetical protein
MTIEQRKNIQVLKVSAVFDDQAALARLLDTVTPPV